MSSRIDKVEAMAQRAYNRIFVTNGDPALIQEIKDIDTEINNVRTTAGQALQLADKNRKFCGLPAEYDPAREGEICPMNEITGIIKTFKKTWKFAVVILFLIFIGNFCISAWNGTQMYKQTLQVTAAVAQLKADIDKIKKP